MTNYFTLHQGRPYLSETYLYLKGISQDELTKLARKFANGTSSLCAYFQEGKAKWFLYQALPYRWIEKFSLPKKVDELYTLHQMQIEDQQTAANGHIHFIFNNAWNDPIRWKPFIEKYRAYYLDNDIMIKFAKTHAVFEEILSLKGRFQMQVIFEQYKYLEDVIFQTRNQNSFRNKVRYAAIHSIEEALIHDFKRSGRGPYKIDGVIKSRIKYYYCLPKKLSCQKILKKVNNERYDRGLPPISLSSVKRVLQDRELRNTCDPIRFGKSYAERFIYPYLNRKDPVFGELIEIDSTQLNIPYKNDNGKMQFPFLCVAMEVYSRKIIGHSLADSENKEMIISCLREALSNLQYSPKQILHDNHKAYYSRRYKKFSNAAFDLGIDFRASKVGNARDKAHVERWFGIFQTEFVNDVFGSKGEGIKTSRVGGRVSEEMEKMFTKKKYLRTKPELYKLIEVLIAKYNAAPRKKDKSPNQWIDEADKTALKPLTRPDMAKMFYESKIRKIRNSQAALTINNKLYTYKIENRILANKLNGTEVVIMHDLNDLTVISIFDKHGHKYICDLSVEQKINIVATNKDKAKIRNGYLSLKKRIEQNLAELNGEIEAGKEQLEATPIVALNPKSQLDEVLNTAEDTWYANQVFKDDTVRQDKVEPKSKDRPRMKRSIRRKGSLKKVR